MGPLRPPPLCSWGAPTPAPLTARAAPCCLHLSVRIFPPGTAPLCQLKAQPPHGKRLRQPRGACTALTRRHLAVSFTWETCSRGAADSKDRGCPTATPRCHPSRAMGAFIGHEAAGGCWVRPAPRDGAGMELGHAAGDAPRSLPQHLCQRDDDDNSLQGRGGLTRMC